MGHPPRAAPDGSGGDEGPGRELIGTGAAGEPTSPAIPGETEDGGEQAQDDLGPRHRAVAGLLSRLASTARSFTLYDAHNETILRFLNALLHSLEEVLGREESLALKVQPFEILFEAQPVYLNRDRERSLAFRLYRDGVRMMRLREGFDGDELMKLLEVLSIRYTGVTQREDDIVTLLWRARFRHLEIQVVEGIVPEDDEAGISGLSGIGPAHLPEEIDSPRPSLPAPVAPNWVDVPEERLVALRAETAASAVPEDCLRLLSRLRELLCDQTHPLRFAEVAHIFSEVRDYLLSDENLGPLRRLLGLLWELSAEEEPSWDPGRHALVYDLIESCGDRRAVRRLLRSVSPEDRRMRPELAEVLTRACPDPLTTVLDVLPAEQGPAVRAVARQILERYGAERKELLLERFEQETGQAASDLLRVIAGIGGDWALSFVAHQTRHPDAAVQDEALWHLEQAPYTGSVGRALFDAFRLSDRRRRSRVLGMIARSGDRRFVDFLADHVDAHGQELSADEGAEIGRVLGQLGGAPELPRWKAWLEPQGLFLKEVAGPLARQVVAVIAMAEVPGGAASRALQEAFENASPELEPWILGALADRHRRRMESLETP